MSALNRVITIETGERIQHFLTQNLGWKIDRDEASFASKMSQITQELRCKEFDSCIRYIESHPMDERVLQAFAREFSVGESYFFRDKIFFDRFEHHILPQIIEKNEHSLSVWSVGCSRGEEIYSVAMLLRRIVPDIESWNLYLLGTDVNPDALDQAKQGIYNQYSFRQMPEKYIRDFISLNEGYTLRPEIKKMVHFSYHNILSDPSPCLPPDGGGFDLILLNNIFIYFEPKKAKTAAEKLFSCVKEGGWLATTATEYSMGIFDFPHSQCMPDGYCIQKISAMTDASDSDAKKPEFDLSEEVIAKARQSGQKEEVEPPLLNKTQKYVHYHDALKMLESGKNEEAKSSLRRSLYLDNTLVMPHVILGNILKKEGKFEAAMKHINNAKAALLRMEPHEEVELSDGMRASDLLAMLDTIKGEKFE